MRLLLLQPQTRLGSFFSSPVELLSGGLAGNVQPRRLLVSAVSGSCTRLGPDRPFFAHQGRTSIFENQVREVLQCYFFHF